MTLLTLAHATKRFTSGQRETVALDELSLEVGAGECVAVYGPRRSGRTTLLRIAAGILPLDGGVASLDGRPLRGPGAVLGIEIGWCTPRFDPTHGGTVADHVAVAALARGGGRTHAAAQAEAALARAGVEECAGYDPRELRPAELVRAGIARALVTSPRLLLLDEPTSGLEPAERDALLALLRALAGEGAGVLMTVGEPIAGADRVLTLDRGRVRAEQTADATPVLPLRPRHAEPVA